MKISYKWLLDYAPFEAGPEEMAVLLTDCGLEVENLELFESVRGNLEGVVVARVLSCEPHPAADRLSLTTVDTGEGDPIPVVCGAPNVAAGQKVLLATVGTTLNIKGEPLEIKKARIRGQESFGMICAEDELGLGESHDGIMVLHEEAPVGMPAAMYLKLYSDHVFEIGLTPNRIDAASHFGVARDLAAVLNHREGKRRYIPGLPLPENFRHDNENLVIPVVIEDTEACPRYSGLTISGVKVAESPAWLKNRLLAIGQKPINNVVDVTNYVLHELGQPLHAFDAGKIEGQRVIIRKYPGGTPFTTLDGIERKLSENDLMICHASGPMCLGGILGGIESGVNTDTRDVFLESAWFDPVGIRRSSNLHGIKTDASFRFERGADPEMTLVALKRAAMMIKEVAGGQISSPIIDEYPRVQIPRLLEFSYERAARLIGFRIPEGQIKAILRDLDIEIMEDRADGLRLRIPQYRVDVYREADVVEELLRIYGYNEIPLPEKMHASLVIQPKPDKEALQHQIAQLLSARGFYEIMNNSLTRAGYEELAGGDTAKTVMMLNPLSQDLNAMRQRLLFGGLETISYNQNRKISDMRLFEFGNIYQVDPAQKESKGKLEGFHEEMNLDLFLTGRQHPETWQQPPVPVNFFDLKSAVFSVLEKLGFNATDILLDNPGPDQIWAYRVNLKHKGQSIGQIGRLSSSLLKAFDIRQDVYYASLRWERLVHIAGKQPLTYREVPKFPEVRRDLALLIDRELRYDTLEQLAYATEKKLLKEVLLFDVYEDDKLGRDKKSYALGFVLQDTEKTLTDKEIDRVMDRLIIAFEKQAGAQVRKQ